MTTLLNNRRQVLSLLPAACLLAACGERQAAAMDVGRVLWQADSGALLQSAQVPVALDSLQGKVLLVFFGYSSCPDVCPVNLGILVQVLTRLTQQERERVRAVFVTVDPLRDTPEIMQKYLGLFHPEMLGLRTANEDALHKMAAAFRVYYKRYEPKAGKTAYAVDHSAHTSLVDGRGRLVRLLPHGGQPDEVLSAVRSLL